MTRPPRTGPLLAALGLALALAAPPALAGSPGGDPRPATPAGCSADAACRAGTDTDGDGLDDLVDGCPTVASGNPTGCPSADRRARLRWLDAKGRLEARITSPVQACASRARIKLWRVRAGGDTKVASENASSSGRQRFRVPRGARYYVTVSPSYASGLAECDRAVSRKVRAPRRG